MTEEFTNNTIWIIQNQWNFLAYTVSISLPIQKTNGLSDAIRYDTASDVLQSQSIESTCLPEKFKVVKEEFVVFNICTASSWVNCVMSMSFTLSIASPTFKLPHKSAWNKEIEIKQKQTEKKKSYIVNDDNYWYINTKYLDWFIFGP